MHSRTTNKSTQTRDVCRIGFEPRVPLSSQTNTQGLPWHRLTYIAFAELNKACP